MITIPALGPYELLTGHHPQEGSDAGDTVHSSDIAIPCRTVAIAKWTMSTFVLVFGFDRAGQYVRSLP